MQWSREVKFYVLDDIVVRKILILNDFFKYKVKIFSGLAFMRDVKTWK